MLLFNQSKMTSIERPYIADNSLVISIAERTSARTRLRKLGTWCVDVFKNPREHELFLTSTLAATALVAAGLWSHSEQTSVTNSQSIGSIEAVVPDYASTPAVQQRAIEDLPLLATLPALEPQQTSADEGQRIETLHVPKHIQEILDNAQAIHEASSKK